VLSLRFGAESIVTYLFGIADGIALQVLTDPDRDFDEVIEAGTAAARYLLTD
jgi:hypothetical protein